MAPQASPIGESSKPSSSQLVIALFLAKSKPSGLSVQGTADLIIKPSKFLTLSRVRLITSKMRETGLPSGMPNERQQSR